MTNKEKIAVGSLFIGSLAVTNVATFTFATKRQLRIDQEVMAEEFDKFLENELPELLRAEREAMMAKDKPNIEYFSNLYRGKLFDESTTEEKTSTEEDTERTEGTEEEREG